ncbi:MAG: flippase-like domain-containing protein [Actinomycetota bacterium]|nr:flippase-like domain-containing protein [Actinomycetota bacterium]
MGASPTSTHAAEGLDLRKAARRGAGFLAVLVLGVVALQALPGLGDVRERLTSAAPAWVVIAIVCELGSVASFPIALRGAFARIMPWRPAFALGLAEQGTNVLVPAGGTGGLAFGAVLLQRRGVPAAFAATRTVVLFLATSLMTFLAVIGAGVTIGLGADGDEVPAWAGFLLALAAATFLGFVALIGRVPTSTAEHQSSLRRLVTRLRNATADGVRATIMLLRRGDVLLIAGSIGYLAFDIAALAATFEALGGGAPSPAAFVLAYTIGQAGSLVPTPAGVGGTEGSLIGMFVLCGASLGAATAAVLAYRVLQLGIPALLGLLASIDLRRMIRTGPTPEEIARRHADDPRMG